MGRREDYVTKRKEGPIIHKRKGKVMGERAKGRAG